MSGYNGFDSWADWNVSLWLNNDEALYNAMSELVELVVYGQCSMSAAVDSMLECLDATTPDGADYTVETVKPVMAEMFRDMLEYS